MLTHALLRGTAALLLAIAVPVLLPLAAQESKEAAPPPVPPPPTANEELQKAVGAPIDPNIYVIGAEDILSILVWREPDLSKPVLVRPDGMITLPLLKDDLRAAGLTPKQLEEQITKQYASLVNEPNVTVSVSTVNSKKYFVSGEVARPGEYSLAVPVTVMEALSKAGGFREFADQKNILIIRGPKRYKFNWKDVVRGKNLQQNIQLESGDHIVVP
jgi:polysaccharide export outer membrane protein